MVTFVFRYQSFASSAILQDTQLAKYLVLSILHEPTASSMRYSTMRNNRVSSRKHKKALIARVIARALSQKADPKRRRCSFQQVSATGSFSLSSPVDGDLGNKLSCQRILILGPFHPAQEDSQSGINCQRQGGVDTQCRRHGFEQDLDCVRDSSQILLLW
ncbi:hypothetical protein BJX68DRAFT_138586 [Aspergillus pseudodeflectus]|uniref:Uncharacterized protein n=1 Tax=Aspergillus pseudodeflectus TaxID=176178 RepID=A0ABR4L2J2_9EURO